MQPNLKFSFTNNLTIQKKFGIVLQKRVHGKDCEVSFWSSSRVKPFLFLYVSAFLSRFMTRESFKNGRTWTEIIYTKDNVRIILTFHYDYEKLFITEWIDVQEIQ